MNESEIIQFLIGGGILTSLIKVIYNKLNSEINKLHSKIEKQDELIDNLKLDIALNYIKKEDFKENILSTTTKIDKIFTIISERKNSQHLKLENKAINSPKI